MARTILNKLTRSACAIALSGFAACAVAQETIKIGIITHDTGPFAVPGQQFRMGIETYRALHGNEVGGRKVEFIYRDVGGPNPAVAKRLAEELITRDKVSILGGFYLTSDALAAASVVNQTKTPSVLFVATSPSVLKQSQFFVRVGQHIAQSANTSATYALQHGKKKAYIAVADYAPGHDVQSAFKKTFEAGGGKVIGEDRIPLNTVDYAAFAERIKNANPDVINTFVPPGAPAVSLIKALASQGLMSKAMVIGMGEADDSDLHLFDDSVIGFYQTLYYGETVDNPENKAFKAAMKKKFGDDARATFTATSAYDGAAAIYRMIETQRGKPFDNQALLKSLRGYSWKSPRGPVTMDADTRELVQNIYVRKTEKVNGRLNNKVVEIYPAVKAPAAN
jgi:branched-chain amino acid transport system substrate-binding protein